MPNKIPCPIMDSHGEIECYTCKGTDEVIEGEGWYYCKCENYVCDHRVANCSQPNWICSECAKTPGWIDCTGELAMPPPAVPRDCEICTLYMY